MSDNIDPHDRQTMQRWTTQLLPPEYMGSHIASGRSHTTGRQHDLAFRAGTAVFGHLGVEWDLAKASAEEIPTLRRWIAFYKQERALLLTGTSSEWTPLTRTSGFTASSAGTVRERSSRPRHSRAFTRTQRAGWNPSFPGPHRPDFCHQFGGAGRRPGGGTHLPAGRYSG